MLTGIHLSADSNKRLTGNNPFFQPRLTINQPNDVYEQQANAMAQQVMSGQAGNSFFKPATITPVGLQRAGEGEAVASPAVESYVNNFGGASGKMLPASARSFFEPRFGYDFSSVRVHTDSIAAKSADSINAMAYTTGNNIVFNQNQYSPETDNGKGLLAHELTHVVQQDSNIHRAPQEDSNQVSGAEAAGGSIISFIESQLQLAGFRSAGPDAIGLIAIPSQSMRAPLQILETSELWGHTAVYVRINGRIVMARGFSMAGGWGPIFENLPGGLGPKISTILGRALGNSPISSPAAIVDDISMFTKSAAMSVEYAVPQAMAAEFAGNLPPLGSPTGGTPPLYEINLLQSCEATNCVGWAVQQVEEQLGGKVGRLGGPSVAELGAGNSQGQVMKFFKDLLRGKVSPSPMGAGVGPGIAGEMPTGVSLKLWGARGLMALAPGLEFYFNNEENMDLGQNLLRTTGVGMDAFALPGLFKNNPKGGIADLAVNLLNIGLRLGGAPEELTGVTQTAADLTPSSALFSGTKAFADMAYALYEGGDAVANLHQKQVEGGSGGMMQGYAMLSDLFAGNMPNIDLDRAAAGDYGILPQAGTYWGDVFSGDRDFGDDAAEIYNYLGDLEFDPGFFSPIDFDSFKSVVLENKLREALD